LQEHSFFIIFFFYLFIFVGVSFVILYRYIQLLLVRLHLASLLLKRLLLAQLHRARGVFCNLAISQRRLVGWQVLLFQDQEVFALVLFDARCEIRVEALRQDLETLHCNATIVLRKKLV
jgi:hypothetical protein